MTSHDPSRSEPVCTGYCTECSHPKSTRVFPLLVIVIIGSGLERGSPASPTETYQLPDTTQVAITLEVWINRRNVTPGQILINSSLDFGSMTN
ncbi:hypothetical protein OUZ56_003581 [Daphnia magna]|uniref:Uncharacterized protein n=1 Tax=Daphnia magna TaxID=35525 RepID=A0ABR0A947_9CRUS|nr:hypothetical protein OUZ56_003581 [Daphnia magna]